MKQVKTLSIFLTLLSVFTSCQDSEKFNITLLSDQIPTVTPTIFGEGIISTDNYNEGSIVFNPDMSELFFNRAKPEEGYKHNIYTMKLIDGKWSEPALASFSINKEHKDVHPRISSNGDRIYFGSGRPLNDSIKSSGLHQWYVEKNNGVWEAPKLLLPKLFDKEWIMCVSPAINGNLYFTSKEKEHKLENEANYYSINTNGRYDSIIRMKETVNLPGKWRAHPYIAPDESYIIFDAETTDIPHNSDLFISFNNNGTWSKARSLGPKINTKISESGATVSPDGKYLFFSRTEEKDNEDGGTYWKSDLYWVDFIKLKKELKENKNSN